ncbi:MAG: DoxX family protein [Propioniciclava sp.]
MNLVRGLGRLLLGGYFISTGVRAVRRPAEFVEATQPLADKVSPLAQRILPESAAGLVPDDAATIVRAAGIASVVGGAGMALGIGTRPAASLAAASMVPVLLSAKGQGGNGTDRAAQRGIALRNLALFGATLVVSQDTKGQPSVLWRVKDTRGRIAAENERTRRTMARDAERTAKEMGKGLRRAKRQAKLQARAARKSIEA